MKTIEIPKLTTSSDTVGAVRTSGVTAHIDQVNWRDKFPKSVPVSVQLLHDGERLFLYFSIIGEAIRAVNTNDFDPIWEDSCVEFFMQREGEKTYRNFECNPLGALLAAERENREAARNLVGDMPSIVRHTTVHHRYDESGNQVSDWTLYLEISKKAMGFGENESLSGQTIRANFYKCGDETVEPHFLSWNRIETCEPNFHVPEFFGMVKFA